MYRLPSNPATTYGPNVQAEFHNNIVCNSRTFLGCQLGEDSSFTLKSNLFYNTDQLAACDPSVDSGQKVSQNSGQNCSGRVVAEWSFGRRQRLVGSGRKVARKLPKECIQFRACRMARTVQCKERGSDRISRPRWKFATASAARTMSAKRANITSEFQMD